MTSDWEDAGQGWEGLEDTLTLVGWSRARRVMVLRRKLTGDRLLTGNNELQEQFAFIEAGVPTARDEYAGLLEFPEKHCGAVDRWATSARHPHSRVRQIYPANGGATAPFNHGLTQFDQLTAFSRIKGCAQMCPGKPQTQS